MSKKYNIAVAGATGMVGRKVLEVLEERKLPIANFYAFASARSAGSKLKFNGKDYTIIELSPENITVHTLAIKRGSLLKNFLRQTNPEQNFDLPDETVVRNMHKIAAESAVRMNMKPYYLYRQKYTAGNLENIGYAKLGSECLYNMQIIEERQTILGIGPSAGTKIIGLDDGTIKSCYNPKDIQTYIRNLPLYLCERKRLLEEK